MHKQLTSVSDHRVSELQYYSLFQILKKLSRVTEETEQGGLGGRGLCFLAQATRFSSPSESLGRAIHKRYILPVLVWNRSDRPHWCLGVETTTLTLLLPRVIISPAASPEISHHTVWRTWLFITYTFLFKRFGEFTFWTKSERVKCLFSRLFRASCVQGLLTGYALFCWFVHAL